MKLKWKVYIIKTQSGKLYTGITTCIDQRFEAHSTKRSGAKFFRFSIPKEIVFCEFYPNRSEASKRESIIKKMTRQEKLTLILLNESTYTKH